MSPEIWKDHQTTDVTFSTQLLLVREMDKRKLSFVFINFSHIFDYSMVIFSAVSLGFG